MRDDNNVIEVLLEKDYKGSFFVNENDCAHLMQKLGINPKIHVEGVQICPQGRGLIYITLKKDLEITKYCSYDMMEVTESGIRSVLVKPATKREVVVNMKGLHPNTKDSIVMGYLSYFGKVNNSKVVYGTYSDGPLCGIRNVDISYKIELKPGGNLGSYHFIDNQKVTMRYPGQSQTYARCFLSSKHCITLPGASY